MRSSRLSWIGAGAVLALGVMTVGAQQAQKQPLSDGKFRLEMSETPSADCGGPDKSEPISGRILGVTPKEYRLLIYAHACNGVLYVQPTVAAPLVNIDAEGKFDTFIHLGQTYYLLLVDPGYKPKAEITEVPEKGGGIAAMFKVAGKKK
jgi:hypothetical protein